jgi:hypothetical protein
MAGPSSSPGSPGVSGAIRDAVSAVADYVAPRSVSRRKATVDKAVSDNDGSHSEDYLSRARDGQSTDSNNGSNY